MKFLKITKIRPGQKVLKYRTLQNRCFFERQAQVSDKQKGMTNSANRKSWSPAAVAANHVSIVMLEFTDAARHAPLP